MLLQGLVVKFWLLLLIALGFSVPANAKWHEAQSDHFVIYADDSEKDVRRFAEMLEQYHASMEFVTGAKVEKPSPSNRVTIFAVGSQRDIRKLSGSKSRNIAGFYVPRAGGSKAFVQDIRLTKGYPHFSTVVLLHEYAHHFLISSSRFAMPRWVTEGSAEFFAAASFNNDGSVQVGRPALHRANELAYADDVPVQELLDYALYQKNKGKKYDAFYGRSWLFYHFLTFTKTRKGQLSAYLSKVAKGTPSIDAGREVFGDLDALEKELDKYLKQRRMFNLRLKPEWLNIGEVSVRPLSKGEEAMMPIRIQSQRGVNAEQAAELLPDARKVARKYSQDAAVLTALAEAEYDAGNDLEAIAAADAAIQIDPHKANAYVQKGYAMFRMAEDADDPVQAFKSAMKPFTALNKIENDHPLPLIYFYRTFARQGKQPTEKAKLALEHAARLAPFDQSLWMNVGIMQAGEGKIAIAKNSLAPLAADPHGGSRARLVKALIDILDRAEEGVPLKVNRNFDSASAEDDTGDDEDGDEGGDEEDESADSDSDRTVGFVGV
jgi:Flp pilus assembly protein TadD